MVIDEVIVLDQSSTPQTSLGCLINEGAAFVAQTYRAGMSGVLSGIKLNILSRADLNPQMVSAVYPLHISIREVLQGFPSTRVLGETIINDGSAPPDRFVSFSGSIRQEAGTRYAIVVHYLNAPSAGAGQWLGNWSGSTGDQYPGGELFYGPEGETWYVSSLKDHDVQFQTFVVPS